MFLLYSKQAANAWPRVLLQSALLLFLSLDAYSTEVDEANPPISADGSEQELTLAIAREEELWLLVRDFVDKKRSVKSITEREVKRWDKLLADKNPTEQKLMQRMYLEMQIEMSPDEPELTRYLDMEEIIVKGSWLDHIELDPAEFSVADIS